MIIYILKHSNSEFSGTLSGVGFDKGRGSSSSKFDRDRCVEKGCKDITDKVKSIQAAQKKKEEAKAAKAETVELKKKKAEEKEMVEKEKKAEKEAAKKEKEEIPEEPSSKEPLEEKTEEPEKEKK